jgi:hypothetical protein
VRDKPLSILLFCDDNPNHASMILDHIDALASRSRHGVFVFNSLLHPGSEALDLDAFDVVVIHYSLYVASDQYLCPLFRRKIREFRGLKIQFIQDEYRDLDALAHEMRYMGIDILFTLLPETEHGRIWGERLPGVKLLTWIAGYVPDRLIGRRVPPLRDRPVDVGYRGREMPYWLGALAQDKLRIGQGFLEHAARYGLVCDISCREEDRFYGAAWDQFNARCRTMLGCGSGATIADADGSCERAVRAYLRDHPGARFEEVAEAVLRPWEGNLNLNVISPRLFEAIAARTGLVLFPGDYSGLLEPDVHYIPLARDFSNVAEVVDRIRDIPFLEAMTARAYDEVIASGRYSYDAFVRRFDDIASRHRKPDHCPIAGRNGLARARWSLRQTVRTWRHRARNALETGQPLRLAFRVRGRRFVWALPFFSLQRLVLRALQKVRQFNKTRKSWLPRALRRDADLLVQTGPGERA